MKDTPLIVQSDRSLLLDVHHRDSDACRNDLIRFCELVKSPEHMHTYTITALSLYNASALGYSAAFIIETLDRWSRFPIAESVRFFVQDMASRWGQATLTENEDPSLYTLNIETDRIRSELLRRPAIAKLLRVRDGKSFVIESYHRGELKLQMIKAGWPVEDRIPLSGGKPISMTLRSESASGHPFSIRPYQEAAAAALLGDMGPGTGHGVILMPCGSGKTVVGMRIMERLATRTLIVTTNVAAVRQWKSELLDKSSLGEGEIGEYSGDRKEVRSVTICTYQVLTWRREKEGPFLHLDLLTEGDWGLVIYDEVHMLPAPIFKVTAELQAIHRLGLTATLVREDGREEEVFSLVGPKRYDVPWSELEEQGYIATAYCHEIRIDLPQELEIPYAVADKREKYRIASENPRKAEVIQALLEHHPDDFILIIGQYLSQLREISTLVGAPIITGSTPNNRRDELYNAFRSGEIRILVVSKVANFAIDLPDASVAIQVSGSFGSRSEEAQRLGRILRPKHRSSFFYSIVTRFSNEEEFSANRQKFLAEQGYSYEVEVWPN
ncbi:MAG: helicase-associated domain-containing protein [Sphaerochaeta sp.]|jgi:DNA excision repair protein ERCC-3|nr:DEAD/DEAH box helicase [Sphaerochaeta sp.]MDX9914988.1 helicase-associated domain-containing protein [Sphaerochaeta sp.]